MEAVLAAVLAHAETLHALCSEFGHGARRSALLDRLESDIQRALDSELHVSVLKLNSDRPGASAECFPPLLLGGGQTPAAPKLTRINTVIDFDDVLMSPIKYGEIFHQTDVLVWLEPVVSPSLHWIDAAAELAETVATLMVVLQPGQSAHAEVLDLGSRFESCHVVAVSDEGQTLVDILDKQGLYETRTRLAALALWKRLPLIGDALLREVQSEIQGLKWRSTLLHKTRLADDISVGDSKDQSDAVKSVLEIWVNSHKEEVSRSNEDGVLPFDARLLVTRLQVRDLILRKEQSAAEGKYTFLQASWFQALLTQKYAVIPDPVAIDAIRSRMANALDMQVRKDIELLNQQAGELLDRLRRGDPLYPLYAQSLKNVRLPVLQRVDFDRYLNNISLEVEIEDSHSQLGFFKRLAEGRMFASMVFSFVTMIAGVFVFFGDPSIKRGLMQFSGVIVIMMVMYFVFSILVKAEEEKKSLEDKLERIREQVFQALQRPLSKSQQGIVKRYGAFLDEVKLTIGIELEKATKQHTARKSKTTEIKKDEEERIRGFLQKRQQALTTLSQKLAIYLQAVERSRNNLLDKPAPAATTSDTSRLNSTLPPRVGSIRVRPAPSGTSAALDRLQALAKRASPEEHVREKSSFQFKSAEQDVS